VKPHIVVFDSCCVVLNSGMEVHVPSQSRITLHTCQGGHYHVPPVFCMGQRVICGNIDGGLTSFNLMSGAKLRSPLPGLSEGVLEADDSGRFIFMDLAGRGRTYVDPETLQVVNETVAMDLPSCEAETARVSTDADVMYSLAKHTRFGRLRQWSVFESAKFGMVAVDIDCKAEEYEIRYGGISVSLTVHATAVAAEQMQLHFVNLAGEGVHALCLDSNQELPATLWDDLARRTNAAKQMLVLILSGRIIRETELTPGTTLGDLLG